MSRRHRAKAAPCQDGDESTRCRVKTIPNSNNIVSRRRCALTKSCKTRYRFKKKPCRGKTVPFQYDVASKTAPCQQHRRVNTTSCQDGVVSKRCCIKIVWCQHGVVPTQRRVIRTCSREELMSTRRRVKTVSCQFEIVPIRMFSNRCHVNTTP